MNGNNDIFLSYDSSAPDISRISLLRLQLLHKCLCLLVVHPTVIFTNIQDDVPDVLRESVRGNSAELLILVGAHLGHHLGVTTDVEVSSLLQELPDLSSSLPETVSHVSLLFLVPAEGGVQSQQAILLPALQFLLVDVVLGLVPAPEVEQGWAHWLALALLPSSLLSQTLVKSRHITPVTPDLYEAPERS